MKRLIQVLKIYPLVFLIVFASCTDLLDQDPYGEIDNEKAIETINDAQTALIGIYGELMRDYWGRNAILFGDIMTDNCFPARSYNDHAEFQRYIYSSSSSEIGSIWLTLYSNVNKANNIINVIDGLSGSNSKKNDIKGQALALRAYAYMELSKWFSPAYSINKEGLGVPIVLQKSNDAKPLRASLEETYTQIESDLLAADGLLVQKTEVTEESVKYMTLWAVKSLLARFYLYKGEYQKAVDYATEVISSNRFSIYGNINDLANMLRNDKGSEIIFQIGYTTSDYGNPLSGFYYDVKLSSTPRVQYVPAMRLTNLYKQFGAANSSKFGTEDIRFRNGGFFITKTTTENWESMICYKYPGNPALLEGLNMPKIIRLPELYLIRAEAYSYLDKDTEALADYNALRKKRIENYVNETGLKGSKLKDEIYNERMRELCFEGFYWFDLKRAGKGFEKSPTDEELEYIDISGANIKLEANSYRWLWPIPSVELNGNQNIQKNPGY
ncbi:MAG: RagB/SusD family nutrient uptake outer membrane protein [Prevotellaceae bacterium]|jgi:hypothetical protein|nr:RagB/SusD family nutrient uptake outer membrane protein [Prevotellaceae bacterium]